MLKKKRLSQKQRNKHNFSLGQFGEKQAVAFLVTQGYQILDTNTRLQNKEVDIIALDTNVNELVFIEVKTRHNDFFGHPSQAVNKRKLRAMQSVARAYLNDKKLTQDYRFDIITLISGRIQHYQNITWLNN